VDQVAWQIIVGDYLQGKGKKKVDIWQGDGGIGEGWLLIDKRITNGAWLWLIVL
jgi:hypothetical protein